jgi:hypothetical protein
MSIYDIFPFFSMGSVIREFPGADDILEALHCSLMYMLKFKVLTLQNTQSLTNFLWSAIQTTTSTHNLFKFFHFILADLPEKKIDEVSLER